MAEELDQLRKECDKLDKKLLPYYSAETIRSLNPSKWEAEQAKRAQAQIQRKHEAIISKIPFFGPELDAIFEKHGLAPLSAYVSLFASIALFFGSVYSAGGNKP